MKEVQLELNKLRTLKTNFDQVVKIGRNDKGYFIIDDKIKRGPFEKIFIDSKDKYAIIGYNLEESKIYELDTNGISLTKKEKLNLEDLTNNNELKKCTLIDSIDNYTIYLDTRDEKFFAIKNNTTVKQISDYKKFDSYIDLIDYYSQFQVYLFNNRTSVYLTKNTKHYIDFNKLYTCMENFDIHSCPKEILFDIITQRNIKKSIFTFFQNQLIRTTLVDDKMQEYLKNGYTEIKSTHFEGIMKTSIKQLQPYLDILEEKMPYFHEESLKILKNNTIDFDKLEQLISNIDLEDLPLKTRDEIVYSRIFTPQVFGEFLNVAITRLNVKDLHEGYKKHINFKVLYPEEYNKLQQIVKEKTILLRTKYFSDKSSKRK